MLLTDGAPRRWRWIALGLGALALGQVMLGALTVLSFVWIGWASLHQLNAVLLLGMLVAAAHELTPTSRAIEVGTGNGDPRRPS